MESEEESGINYFKDKINHLIEHLDTPSIKIQLISKEELIFAQNTYLELYKISKGKINKQHTIHIDSTIKSILVKGNNNLIVSTNKGIIFFQKNKKNEFTEIKRIKPTKKNEIYYFLLDLKDNNLIMCFSLSFLKVINISTYQFVSLFKFQSSLKGSVKKCDNEVNINEKKENEKKEAMINLETFDPRSQAFLIKKNNNYLVCFKLLGYCVILNYKNMKIIKKFDFSKNFSFTLYKPENEYKFFYIILIKHYESPNVKVLKYNTNLQLKDTFEAPFKFPLSCIFLFENKEEEDEDDDLSNHLYSEDDCIYKSIVKDVKNCSFIYHCRMGAPEETDFFILYHCKNGEIKQKQLGISFLNCDEPLIQYNMIKFENNKYIIAKRNLDKGIEEIKLEDYGINKSKKKLGNINKGKKKILFSDFDSDYDSDYCSEENDKMEKKIKKSNKKKKRNDSYDNDNKNKLLGKKIKAEKDKDEKGTNLKKRKQTKINK